MRLSVTLSIIYLISTVTSLNAGVLIVNNSSAAPGQFASLQSAIGIASPGDTIYIAGTDITYGAISLNKQLTLIGPGFDLTSGAPSSVAQIGVLGLTAVAANGSRFIGLRIFQIISTDVGISLFTNLEVLRCQIDDCLYLSNDDWNNCLVDGCLFTSGGPNVTGNNSAANLTTSTIRSNIFAGTLFYVVNNTIKNNIFSGNTNGNGSIISGGTTNTFHNNICIGRNCLSVDIISNITSNISFSCASPNFNGTGNFPSTDPLFVSYAPGPYSWNHNFNLQVGSPAIGTGSGSTNIGLYGGEGKYRRDHEPDIPVLRSLTLPGTNVFPVNSNISIQINSVIHE